MKKTTKKTPCDKIPADFVYCFNKTCPRSAECLRFFLGEQSSERPESFQETQRILSAHIIGLHSPCSWHGA